MCLTNTCIKEILLEKEQALSSQKESKANKVLEKKKKALIAKVKISICFFLSIILFSILKKKNKVNELKREIEADEENLNNKEIKKKGFRLLKLWRENHR